MLIRLRKQEWELKADSAGFIGVAVPRMDEVAEVRLARRRGWSWRRQNRCA